MTMGTSWANLGYIWPHILSSGIHLAGRHPSWDFPGNLTQLRETSDPHNFHISAPQLELSGVPSGIQQRRGWWCSLCIILSLAAELDLELHQTDVKGAYLNGELNDSEVIYMRHPPGYGPTKGSKSVLRLQKTLYGLKQSGCCWYQKLKSIFKDIGLACSEKDQAVFYKNSPEDSKLIIAVHVNDCTIAATSFSMIQQFKSDFARHVEISDLGKLHWVLGIEVKRDRDRCTISICQCNYIHCFNLQDLKPLSTPMDPSIKLSTSQAPSNMAEISAMRDIPYQQAIGSLMYAVLTTRPDIAFAVTMLSQFSQDPGPMHWEQVKHIYCYLIGTKGLRLTYGGVERKPLHGFADTDGNMQEDCHAISGYTFILNGGAVSWSSKRQEIILLSTTESEYVATTRAAKEALWMRQFIGEIFFPFNEPTTLFSDNLSAIALTQDHKFHARTKHIDIRFHFLCWATDNKKLFLVYCPTNDMVADQFTKALPSLKVKHFGQELGLRPA